MNPKFLFRIGVFFFALGLLAGLNSCISTDYEPPVKLRDDNLDNLVPYAYVQSTCVDCFVLTYNN